MSPKEMQLQLLARVLITENQKMISKHIRNLTAFPSVDLVDKCNLPLLMTRHAPQNPDVQIFLENLKAVKTEIHETHKHLLLKIFKDGLTRKTAGGTVIFERVTILTLMLLMEDPDYVRLAYELFNNLKFDRTHYATVLVIARRDRNQYPEAESLVRKLEILFRQLDRVDENMEMEEEQEEDGNEDVDGDSEDDEDIEELLNDSFGSDDSGFVGESDEILVEDVTVEIHRDNLFETVFIDVLLSNLIECMKSGNPLRILLALERPPNWHIPLYMYRKHEVSRVIHEHQVQMANSLYEKVEMLGEDNYADEKNEVFWKILCVLEPNDDDSMELLMTYWRKEEQDYYIHTVVKTLLRMNLSLELIVKYSIEERLQRTEWKTREFFQLHNKIVEINGARGIVSADSELEFSS